jgi:hypothetical protein
MIWSWEDFGRVDPGCQVRIVDEVTGTERTVATERTRGEIIEALLFGGKRSMDRYSDDEIACLEEPLGVCICVKPDAIIMRYYVNGSDTAAALAALEEIRKQEGIIAW